MFKLLKKRIIRSFNLSILVLTTVLVAGSCKTPATPQTVATGDSSQNAVDWVGVYTAVMPCGDCSGIATVLQLNQNGSYEMTRTYEGKSAEPFKSTGKFNWDANGSTIQLEGENPGRFQVGENQLFQLDAEGKRITGDLADSYILKKDMSGIAETYWKLVELNGKPIAKTEGMLKEPHLIFHAATGRVTGNGGCNSLMGSYELLPGDRIRFSKMAATLMACPENDIEEAFLKMLETADNYVRMSNQLVLNRARMAPLARFEAVALR